MKKSILAAAAVAALGVIPSAAFADLAFNVGGVTDYRYRGISQTRGLGALQGGVDYSLGGLYLGAWASTIRWVQDAGGSGDLEVDLYGGYKGEIVKDLVSYDVGGLFYYYPGNNVKPITGADANTLELYGAVTVGPATAKLSYAVTDTFGNFDSKGSTYAEIAATFDIGGGVMLTPHFGWQRITGRNRGPASYVDGSIALSKDVKGVVFSLTGIVNRKIDGAFYSSPYNGQYLGKSTLVAGLKYNF